MITPFRIATVFVKKTNFTSFVETVLGRDVTVGRLEKPSETIIV